MVMMSVQRKIAGREQIAEKGKKGAKGVSP